MTAPGQPRPAGSRQSDHPTRPQAAVMGIDLGTSSVKVVITTLDAQPLTHATQAYTVQHPGPVRAESNPADWQLAVTAAVRQATAQAPSTSIVGIGLSGQMHGVVTIDQDGRPTRPAILWADARATDQLPRYSSLPTRQLAILSNPLSPGMAGPILAWLAEHEQDTLRRSRWALQPKDWIRYWLTGTVAAEPSDASATLLYDLNADTWALEVADTLGIDRALLPQLLPQAGAIAGTLTPTAAKQLGLTSGTPVAAGGADTAVAALGTGLTDVGAIQLTIGTGAQITTPVGTSITLQDTSPEPTTHLYRTATTTGYYRMAASLNGGLALSWVLQILGTSWGELYASADTPPSPSSPLFLPHLNGERTPYLSSQMRGGWIGLAPEHTRADLLRAALEGVAFGVKDALRALTPDKAPDVLRLAGGGTTSPPWRQMLADVLQVDLVAVDDPAASGRGAAMLGAQAAGLVDEHQMLTRLAPTMHPVATTNPDQHRLYQERFHRFRQAAELLRPLNPSTPELVDAWKPMPGQHHSRNTSPARTPTQNNGYLTPSQRRYPT